MEGQRRKPLRPRRQRTGDGNGAEGPVGRDGAVLTGAGRNVLFRPVRGGRIALSGIYLRGHGGRVPDSKGQ